jgi:hypothetical protein
MFFGIDYTTTASGAVLKFVQCEECGDGYAYWMSRQIKASQFSPFALDNRDAAQGSRREARKRLRAALANSCDPVPCPHCGWYQEAMVLRLRKIRFKWVTPTCFLLFLSPLWLLFFFLELVQHGVVPEEYAAPGAGAIVATTWGLIPLLLGGRYLLNRAYDPNRKPAERRIALGKKLALSEMDYARAIAEFKRQQRDED